MTQTKEVITKRMKQKAYRRALATIPEVEPEPIVKVKKTKKVKKSGTRSKKRSKKT